MDLVGNMTSPAAENVGKHQHRPRAGLDARRQQKWRRAGQQHWKLRCMALSCAWSPRARGAYVRRTRSGSRHERSGSATGVQAGPRCGEGFDTLRQRHGTDGFLATAGPTPEVVGQMTRARRLAHRRHARAQATEPACLTCTRLPDVAAQATPGPWGERWHVGGGRGPRAQARCSSGRRRAFPTKGSGTACRPRLRRVFPVCCRLTPHERGRSVALNRAFRCVPPAGGGGGRMRVRHARRSVHRETTRSGRH